MKIEFRKFLKKAAIIILVGGGYSLWLWRDSGLAVPLLLSNVFSVIGMVFLVIGLFGLVHNAKGLASFTYSFRYVANMVRNVRNNDAATNERVPEYFEYRDSVETWGTTPLYLAAAALFIGASLLMWKIF